jgi:hypothetical protein
MSLREFAGVESDFVFQPVRLEGEQALVHSNRDACGGQFVRVRAAFGVKGNSQAVQLRRQRFEETTTFETTGATGLTVALAVGEHAR